MKLLKSELFLLFVVLVIAGASHAYNMFNFPYFENDEGTYMSQAWSLVTMGKLSPYTYWYDHAPAGWILIALWTLLTGGISTFGFSLNSGRVLMLVLHIASSFLVYLLAKRFTHNKYFAAFSVLLYSLSPLALYFHRRILLDNIMTFWLLSSIYFVVKRSPTMLQIVASGILFGIATLTKESAVFFLPFLIYVLYLIGPRYKNILAWLVSAGGVILLYPLFAFQRGELFPYGSMLGGDAPHVSLYEGVVYQLSRTGGSLLDLTSPFWSSYYIWTRIDPLFLWLGVISTLINLLVGIKDLPARVVGLSGFFYILLLLRGGLVLEFYIIPLLPFLAINIAYLFWRLSYRRLFVFSVSGLAVLVLGFMLFYSSARVKEGHNVYTSNQTRSQKEALDWIVTNYEPDTYYVIDNYAYIDLHTRIPDPKKIEWYWKVDFDPDVTGDIDYLALTPQMERDILKADFITLEDAYQNAERVTGFSSDGWGVEILRVIK